MLAENLAMQHVLKNAGFTMQYSPEDQLVQAALRL
jgi:hypothetical protein